MILSKSTKIFLIVFSAVLFIITIITIVYTNLNKDSDELQVIIEDVPKSVIEPSEISTTQDDSIYVISLEDTYDNNGVTYEYKNESIKEINVTYPVIDGLKDTSVEESINNQIKDRITKIFESNNFKNNSDSSAYANASVVANFSDVISVKIFVKFNENFSKNYGVSFKLEDGSRIKLDELFVSNAPRKNIISMSAYRSFAINYYTQEGLSNEFYSNIEADLLNFMIDYNNDKVTEFSFTPMNIELYREGKTVSINMGDWLDYIAIYRRFLADKDLYENMDNVAKNVPVLVKRPDSIIDLYEKVNDTCIIDVILYCDDANIDFSEKEINTIENYKNDLIERLKNIKTEKGIYYSNYINISRGKENDEDILIFTENEKYATTNEEEFYDNIYNKILLAQRDVANENKRESAITVLDKNLIGESTVEKKYSINTMQEVKEVEEQEENDMSEDVSQEDLQNDSEQENVREQEDLVDENQDIGNTTNTTNTVETPSTNTSGNITTQVFF